MDLHQMNSIVDDFKLSTDAAATWFQEINHLIGWNAVHVSQTIGILIGTCG